MGRPARCPDESSRQPGAIYLARDALEPPLALRPRQTGDEITLPRRGGTKSLKKLFIDRKIPAHLRPLVPVLCDDAGVLGVPGIGVSRDRRGRQWTFRFIKEENILTESRGYHG